MAPSPFHGIFTSIGQNELVEPEMVTHSVGNAPVQEEVVQEAPVEQVQQGAASGAGQIAVDIYEQDNYYIIRAPIAGVRLSDLDIEVEGKVITIRGTRRISDEAQEDQYYLQECFWGEFSRSVTLPSMIDPKKVKATFSKDCILKVIIPKEEKVKIIRINEGG